MTSIFLETAWYGPLYTNFTRNLRKRSCRAPLNSEPLSLYSTRSEGVHFLCFAIFTLNTSNTNEPTENIHNGQ